MFGCHPAFVLGSTLSIVIPSSVDDFGNSAGEGVGGVPEPADNSMCPIFVLLLAPLAFVASLVSRGWSSSSGGRA